MAHDDDHDDDACNVPGCPVHDPENAKRAPAEVQALIVGSQHPRCKLAVVVRTSLPIPVQDSVALVTNDPPFLVTVLMACNKCQEQHQWQIPGHHVATVHRALGEILAQYPKECEELRPVPGKLEKKDAPGGPEFSKVM